MPRANFAKKALGQLVNAASQNAPAEGAAFTQLFNAAKGRAMSTAANRTAGRIAGNGAVDDGFTARVEQAVAGFGFTGDNSIAMSNLCRDESCLVLEDKVESTFGSCFSTHGLGGVLPCGVVGIKAGLRHSPVVGAFNAVKGHALSTLASRNGAVSSLQTTAAKPSFGGCACTGPCRCHQPPMVFSRLLHAHPNPPKDPNEALDYLRQGNERFVSGKLADVHPTRNLDRVKATAGGQKPFAAFLSCADSRVPVEIIFDQGFGDVFVTRVAGNIVTNEITASLEFGTAVLGSKVLMVLGHSSCGAVAATSAGAAVPGVISSLYYSINPAVKKCKHGDLDGAIAENVKHQMEQLKVSPVLSGLVKEGKLKIVGGVYDLATGKVTEVA